MERNVYTKLLRSCKKSKGWCKVTKKVPGSKKEDMEAKLLKFFIYK